MDVKIQHWRPQQMAQRFLALERCFPIERLVQQKILHLLRRVILFIMAILISMVEAQVAHMAGETMTRPTPVLRQRRVVVIPIACKAVIQQPDPMPMQ